jgi:hypothetical protein
MNANDGRVAFKISFLLNCASRTTQYVEFHTSRVK